MAPDFRDSQKIRVGYESDTHMGYLDFFEAFPADVSSVLPWENRHFSPSRTASKKTVVPRLDIAGDFQFAKKRRKNRKRVCRQNLTFYATVRTRPGPRRPDGFPRKFAWPSPVPRPRHRTRFAWQYKRTRPLDRDFPP